MRLVCPNCAAAYEIADDAIGPNGRKVRCRSCETSWFEPPRTPPPFAGPATPAETPPPAPLIDAVPLPAEDIAAEPRVRRPLRLRAPLIALGLGVLVVLLAVAVALIAFGPQRVATGLGLSKRHVPLGIAITKQPDWRMIAGGSELFAVSGRIWNPTAEAQAVPDIRAELKDARGHTVYSWTIDAPVPRIAPGRAVDFDGAAVDVPRSSQRIAVSFAGTEGS